MLKLIGRLNVLRVVYVPQVVMLFAVQILEEMEENGTPFNALTWSLHVEYHVVLGDAQAAAAVQQAAEEAGFQIRASSFEKLIARCERNGEAALLVSPLLPLPKCRFLWLAT